MINLYDLWYVDPVRLSDERNTVRCIYLCSNKLNSKVYVGSTRMSLYERWTSAGIASHFYAYNNNATNVLYRAIRKYSPQNFEVSILESELPDQELLDREYYWIKFYHSYIHDEYSNGYNMTIGGASGFCDPTVMKICIQKSLNTRRSIGNGDALYACHTEEVRNKQRLNHGGQLPFNTPEFYELQRVKYGDGLAFNLPQYRERAARNQSRTKILNKFYSTIKKCDSINEIIYYYQCGNNTSQRKVHIDRLLNIPEVDKYLVDYLRLLNGLRKLRDYYTQCSCNKSSVRINMDNIISDYETTKYLLSDE